MNSAFLAAQAAYKSEVENTEETLKELARQRKEIQDRRLAARQHMLDVFLENFSGSDEDVAFLMDYSQTGHHEGIYNFHHKYFGAHGLRSDGLYGENNQVALQMRLSDKTDEEIRAMSAYLIKQPLKIIKPIQKEVNFNDEQISGYRFFEILLNDTFDYDSFEGGLHLIEKDGKYAVGSATRFHSVVLVDWNDDLAETLIKTKAILVAQYTYCEEDRF